MTVRVCTENQWNVVVAVLAMVPRYLSQVKIKTSIKQAVMNKLRNIWRSLFNLPMHRHIQARKKHQNHWLIRETQEFLKAQCQVTILAPEITRVKNNLNPSNKESVELWRTTKPRQSSRMILAVHCHQACTPLIRICAWVLSQERIKIHQKAIILKAILGLCHTAAAKVIL